MFKPKRLYSAPLSLLRWSEHPEVNIFVDIDFLGVDKSGFIRMHLE